MLKSLIIIDGKELMMREIPPIHPGRILEEGYLNEMDITPNQLAKAMGVQQGHISQLIEGKQNITANIALRLERALGPSAQFWMNLQTRYELEMAKESLVGELGKIMPLAQEAA